MKIKIIDLFNKIANGEELPLKILILDEVYYLLKDDKGNVIYSQSKEINNREAYINHKLNLTRCLNEDVIILDDKVEIIEDEDINIQDINIQGISVLPEWGYNDDDMRDVINNLIKAVKKLDKEK